MALHQDHGNSVSTCKSAIDLGFTSVMMDGSLMEDGKTPSSFEYNVKVTRDVVELAHARGVRVEGEIGVLGGIEDGHGAGGTGLEHVTDPDHAVEFVEKTGLDALAIAIGTSHGAYKFTKKPTGETLKMDRLIEINKRPPHTHLVMHGSSSVPKELQDVVNQSRSPLFFIPKKDLRRFEDRICDGDLIAVTTNRGGLDVQHVGLAARVKNRVHLLHASSGEGRVVLSQNTLYRSLMQSRSRSGIMMARLV